MARSRKDTHPHMYVKQYAVGGTVVNKSTWTWKCALPGCNYFVHRGLEHIQVGREATCSQCASIFMMTAEKLQMDRPKCDECVAYNSTQKITPRTYDPDSFKLLSELSELLGKPVREISDKELDDYRKVRGYSDEQL